MIGRIAVHEQRLAITAEENEQATFAVVEES
jgi:hypothetical protein